MEVFALYDRVGNHINYTAGEVSDIMTTAKGFQDEYDADLKDYIIMHGTYEVRDGRHIFTLEKWEENPQPWCKPEWEEEWA